MANANLTSAKKAKNDEFYTQYPDIEKEMSAYISYDPDTFRGKVVYCNCDDPYESNFFKYFVLNFNRLGLKKLITTSYKPSPIANTQLGLFGDEKVIDTKGRPKPTANKFIITEVGDYDNDGSFSLEDIVRQLKENKHNEWSALEGEGDFRSPECIELLKDADIVVTNPPFSLFREYIAQLVEHGKKFAVIGNMNAITYKEIFPLIKENKMWMGTKSTSQAMFFSTANEEYKERVSTTRPEGSWWRRIDGEVCIGINNSCWFTNIDHGRRHQPLQLMTMADNRKFNKKVIRSDTAYKTYDNYDAIEVPFTDAIPSDYDGVMGVPISFLDKYSPEQFYILGATQRGCHDEVPDTKKYDEYWEVRQTGERTGSSGGKTNENANLESNDGKKNYFINNSGHIVQSAYQRIFIKRKGEQL